jgi:hypothetical protein
MEGEKYKKFWEELIAYFPWYDTGHIENDASNNSYIVSCVFVTTVMFLLSRCLATIGGFLQSRCLTTIRGYLPSRCLTTIRGYLPSHCLTTIRGYLPSRCLATLGGHTQTQTATWYHKPTLFFQNKKTRLNQKERKVERNKARKGKGGRKEGRH